VSCSDFVTTCNSLSSEFRTPDRILAFASAKERIIRSVIEARQTFQPTFTPTQSHDLSEWQRQSFKSDEDLLLPVSIYLESGEEHREIIENVMRVVHAYGFTNIVQASQAPGSFFFHMDVGFESKSHEQARQQKRKLTKALLEDDDSPNSTPEERRAVKKVKQSLWARLKKGISAITVGSVLLLAGNLAVDASKDAVKDLLKDTIKVEIKNSVRNVDTFVLKELPPAEAQRFHKVVQNFIDSSPDKTSPAPPTKKPG
jgi:hypothetical protein